MGKSWTSCLLVLFMWTCLGAQQMEDTLSFQFTHPLYNVMIYENSAAKTFVECPIKMGIFMTNQSWDIWYVIESGDHDNLFKAEKYVLGHFCFLRIRTKGGNSATLNREVKDHYLLTVNAIERHTGAETQTQVKVQVMDTNDLRPLFSPTTYSFFVPENSAIRTSVGRVFATDADTGTNGEYYFSFKEWNDMFSIHPTSGVITLTGKLDYSEVALYEIDVLAVDRGLKLYGSSSSSSTAKLKVHVLPANEHAPVITAVPLTPWNTTRDSTYAYVTVEDADEGHNGEIASLSIVAGDPLQQFKAFRTNPGSKEYKIKAIKDVEWEGCSFGCNLTLQAKDRGNPPKFSSAIVVRVKSPSEYTETPTFEKSVYRVTLSEFAPPHSPVVMVKTVQKHSKITYLLQFKMQQHENPFVINPNTGLITTVAPVKAESVSQYEFDVVTSDRQAVAKVVISVSDVNNNAPVFQKSYYEASIAEHMPIGTSVLTVSATDKDDGENGYVTYSIVNVNKQPFVVDYFTGVISTAEDLDYETMPRKFSLRIRASDWGSPFRREAEIVVSITLTNLNDNKPHFENMDCDVTVPRSLGVGEQIIVVSAIDADDLGVVQYRIDSGNNMNLFELDSSSGVLTLKKSLRDGDAAKQSFHRLQITASDGEISSNPMFLNLTVVSAFKHVRSKCAETGVLRTLAGLLLFGSKRHSQKEAEDEFADIHSVNRHTPRFIESTPTVIEVKEDLPVGTSVALLRAADSDSGFSGKLLFVISGGDFDSCFTIESDTGWLKVFEPLDRETTDHYTLNITVYDLGLPQKSSSHMVNVNILDVNDNSPEFLQSEYSVDISEDIAMATDIIQLIAKDKDLGVNGMVRYSFLTKTDKFVIHEETGIVTVMGPLDREANPSFVLKVAAFDAAIDEPKMVSTALLYIKLEDVNDNAPTFIPQQYHIRVREDIPVGTLVLWLETHDPDLGLSGQVRYSLTDGEDGSFQVDKMTGAVYVSQTLDFETRQVYNLTAKAKDRGKPNPLSSSCFIHVEIVDVNENLYRPSFPFFVDWGAVSEDAPSGTSVLKVAAHDEDSGRDGEVRYSIQGGSGLGVFTIDEDSGIIRTQEILDRETSNHYWLTIYATDQGIVPLSSFVEVYIEVKDVNDNAPLTSEPVYYSSVSENSPKDVSVIQIQAFDLDTKSSDNLSYKITSGNPQGFFVINTQTGKLIPLIKIGLCICVLQMSIFLLLLFYLSMIIMMPYALFSVSVELDREYKDWYELVIKASDKGEPPLSVVTTAKITVTISDNTKPKFPFSSVSAEVSESVPVGSFVTLVSAFSQSTIYYQIKEGNVNSAFDINPNSGAVITRKKLDFETLSSYKLIVQGSDMAERSSSVTVNIHLKDENDNAPVFTQPEITGFISESAIVRSLVLTSQNVPLVVRATDADQHLNGRLVYEIVEPFAHDYFSIDSGTGAIQTLSNLDYEQRKVFVFRVQVHDIGMPRLFAQNTANVTIYVININDCAPKFTQDSYETTLLLPTYKGVKVTTVKATDEDSLPDTKLRFELVDGNIGNKFKLDPTSGDIFVQNATQLRSRYRLTVQVSDGSFTGTATVKVSVQENKGHNLKFTQEIFTAYVQENSAEKKTLAILSVVGNRVNEPLFYSILNPNSKFEMGRTSGVLFSTGIPFDREEQDLFEIYVEVTKEPTLNSTAHVLVRVHIEDVNDNAPVFVDQPYNVIVPVDKTVGSVIRKVTTVDKDIGRNAKVTYNLKGHDKYFQVSPSGEISLKKPLELKSVGKFVINITAQDGGEPPLFSKAEVVISVVNKATPMFERPFYKLEIPENVQVRTSVLQVIANQSAGPRTVYSICGGNPFNQFYIDFNSGLIEVIQPLDYEAHPAYRLCIQATDSLTGANSDVFVDIILEDVNDNAPKFEAAVYNITISESAVIGTSVLQVVAMDSDTGSNAILFYQLYEKDGATSDHFRIDVESGVIWTAGLLDHETQSQHELIIKALDHGAFQLSAEVQVIIYVTDLNDNPPLFAHQLYNATISKISSPGQLVTCVKAYDADSHGTSQLEYAILSGNDNNIFAIDASSGEIVIANFSQQSLGHFYSLVLSVTDGIFRSTAEANIYMMGENSHSPSFTQDEYVIELAENSPVGTLVGQVEAIDKDPGIYGQLTFFILNDIARDKFTINDDGQIHTVESFDREKPEEKTISISLMAKDGGGRLSFCTVIVTLSDVNDNSPKFRLSEYKVTVPGDAPSGTTVIKTSAVDEDEGSNADIIYTIDSDIGHFEIHPLTGAIVTKESLIGLENGLYSLLVKAKDSGSPPRQSVIPVSIRIVPPETSIPKFAEPSLLLELSEDLAVGSEMDIFQTENERPVIYSLVGGNTPESNKDDVFAIDSSTGKLTLTKRLDYETIKWYQLAVQVRDAEDSMEIVSIIDVSIHLKDVNDNSPQFESYPYQSYIVENLPKGTSVVQVKATDLDSWLNGQVTYTLHGIQERSDVLEMFAVDSESGWITTLTEIDREKTDRYRITVLATDRAQGLQMTGTTVVEVTVVDTNDHPPLFTEAVFKGTVREDESTPGTVVTILSYTDSDSEEVNRRFSCFITGGDPQGLFDVRHTDGVWVVAVSKTLDREERDFYLLNITATDGAFETKSTVEITVLDANDNSPVCEKDVYTQTVPEDALVGRQILQVSATDADIQSNAEITYQLSGSGAESFTIDAKTGAVRTLVTLDREMTDVYNLTVRAVDGGNRFCQASVFITVDDVNDNSPKFPSDQHHISIFHNTQPGAYVARLEAFDADIGMNGKIRYTFEDSAGGLFSIEESSGIISLQRSLDRQTKATHVLRVRATDHGSPHRLSSLSSVVVTVLDANDHPLAFEHREYVSTVPEDVAIGTKLLNVFAASKKTMTSQTTYSITSGNEQGALRIDSQTGDIFVMEPLDYEASPQHFLTVKATTRGTESLSAIATVTIHLLDINDNSPVFSQKIYSAVVSEDTKLESAVLTVLANDFDGPLNNRIRYSIENYNQTCPFIMDAVSGELRLAHQLDREKVASYMLTVLASDSGNPPKSDSAAINMTVSDVNDNPPVFSQANYSLIIQENLPSGAAVLQLNVTDNDSPQNGPPFSFSILKGEETSPFSIDQQGVVKTVGPLRKGQHILQVQVSDNGRPPLKSVTSVSVLVLQTSVYPPSVLSLDVFIMILEDEYLGGKLGKVQATDQDEYDTLTFSLEPQSHSLFSVVATDGRLSARGGLDVGHYQLNVSVSDGRFSALSGVTVNVLRVTEQMLDSSVSVRFAGIAAEDFIQDHWKNLQKVVRSVAGVRRGALQLISLQSAETGNGLDVLLCFEKPGRGGSSLEAFSQKLSSSRAAIKEMTGLHVVRVLNSQCSSSECPGSICRRVVLLNQTSMATYSTARVSYVTPRHHMTAKCLCTGIKCQKHETTCEDSPCPQGYECVSGFEEDKHSCVCTGAAKVKCSGNSELISLSEKTVSSKRHITGIVGGRLQFQFDCGWGLATVSVHSVLVNDGQWHMAELEVKGNYARLVLDQLHSASGLAPGPLHCLNLGDQVVLGGPAQRFGSRLRRNLPVSDSLQGCMDSVLFNGQRLSLDSNGPLGVAIEDMVGVSPGCVFFLSPDCSSNPCLNGGSCLMRQSGGYVCKCSTLFSGTHCEVKISPCDSNPCLYGGTCIQNNLDYYCKCRGHYSGQRCQIGPYCKENPCQNGGHCIDGLDGPICECEPGFKGEGCMIDVDECVDRPCFNNGHCVNTYGSFNCSCSVGFSGRLCEMDTEVRNQLVSSSWNAWIGELVAMLAFLTAIFVLTLFFLIVWKGTCKPDKSDKVLDKYKDVDSYIQRSSVYNQARKESCPDTPPQVPVRPISYTPSIPGECRNNRGSVPEYSSFTPDALFGLRKSVAVCSVAPNLPHLKASHSHSKNYSLQQMDWDEEYDEKVLHLTSCLAVEEDSISFTHENRGLRSMSSLQADVMDDNSYYWDTADCLQNIYSPGIQGFLQYEFVQMPYTTHTSPEILDMDYLTGGDDIDNFLPVPALPLNNDMSAVPQYDQYTRPEVHHVIHPTATASQHHIHDYPQPIQTTFGVPQGQHIGPSKMKYLQKFSCSQMNVLGDTKIKG
uniref:FAT atypical cadherin 1b n=1 Tax=Cyprinus carpio TaxID=7962 RepID=A0A8C1TTF3_CYPCA